MLAHETITSSGYRGTTYTALSHATNVGDVPRRVEALVSAILAHGAHPDTVRQFHAADLEWREELGDWIAGWLGSSRTTSHRILLRGEERGILGRDVCNRRGTFGVFLKGWRPCP